MRYTRLYSDAGGVSHFEELELDFASADFAPPAPPVHVSAPLSASAVVVLRAEAGLDRPGPSRASPPAHGACRRRGRDHRGRGDSPIRDRRGRTRGGHRGRRPRDDDSRGRLHRCRPTGLTSPVPPGRRPSPPPSSAWVGTPNDEALPLLLTMDPAFRRTAWTMSTLRCKSRCKSAAEPMDSATAGGRISLRTTGSANVSGRLGRSATVSLAAGPPSLPRVRDVCPRMRPSQCGGEPATSTSAARSAYARPVDGGGRRRAIGGQREARPPAGAGATTAVREMGEAPALRSRRHSGLRGRAPQHWMSAA
jgi:hypothetical protein